MIDEKFVILAAVIILLGDLSYLYLTIKGKVKPNKVTWFLWAFVPLIAFSAQIIQNVGIYSLMTLAAVTIPALIFFASFLNKNAYWKITRFDLFCGLISVIGLILWAVTSVGNLAILFSIFSDGTAAVPTVIKAYKEPDTENYLLYLFNAIGGAITLLAIKQWDFEFFGFPLYLFFISFTIFLLIKFKLGKKIKKYA